MIAMRYGTVPVVRRTGGLADTVVDADADRDRGNGFTFDAPDPSELLAASARLMAWYGDRARWRGLMERGMAEDHGWAGPAREYEAAYRRAADVRSIAG